VEITVVMEEGVVLRRGSLVLAPSEEKSTVMLVPTFGTKFTPTLVNIICGLHYMSLIGAVIVPQDKF
jgi:hypothetical protein